MMAMVGNLAQVCQDAEALLTIDVSDDLTPIGLQTSEKPVVPSGADDLVAYYEKQLAAAQLVQQRLEKQCHQLAEEKLALETSLSVQTSAMQQQLVLAREKAERVFAQAEHAQQQVHDARAAVSEVVDAVTHLAELLDVSGATKELTQSFEAVARSTQRTFQAVTAAQEGAQVVLDLQLGARDACQVSPLFAALSAGGHHEVDAMRKLEEDAIRLRKELDSARRREQELEAEMRAAQVLFSGLEAEVVSLQHDQAQAAAKLQLSQEELLAARDEIIVAQQALLVAQSPAAGVLTQGLAKLDGHLVSVRNFLEELSMPKPPVIDELGCSNLQLHAGRSRDGNSVARNLAGSGDMRASPESGTFLRQLEASPQHLRSVMAVVLDGSSASPFIQGVVRRAHLRDQIDAEQAFVSEQSGAQAEGQEAARYQLSDHSAVLSQQMAFVAEERDVLRSCTAELASRITSLEMEKEGMLRNRAQQLSMAAAAGAAGAAAAVAVTRDAGVSTATPSLSQSPSVIEAEASAYRVNEVVLATLKERLRGSESAIAAVAAERDAAVERSECLVEEVETLRELLQQGIEGQDGACRLLERLIAERTAAGSQFLDKKPARSAKLGGLTSTAADMAVSADLSAAQYSDVPLPGSPSSPVSRPSPSRTRRCRSDISIVSDSHTVNEARDLFFEQGEPLREMSRAYTLSSTAVQSSYQSFTSEAPLVPTRRYTDDSQPHTYPLDPTEPLEELLPTPAGSGATALNRGGGGITREGGRDLRRSHRNSHSGHDVQSLLAEVAQLQAAVCSLVISKAVTYAELQAESEQNLAAIREAHQAEMASLREEYLAEVGQLQALVAGSADVLVSAPMPHLPHGRYLDKATSVLEDGLPVGQYEAELLQRSASLEIRIVEMEEQQKRLLAMYEDQLRRTRGEFELRLADAASCLQQEVESRGAHDTEIKTLQLQISELRHQLASQLAEHKIVLAELNAEANRHRTAAEEQQRKLEGELLLRESLVGELRGELQRLQNEKELEEQSFQSLLSTKSWMSEEIRSLQAQLKETSSKLALAGAELARLKIAGASGNPLGTSRRLVDASTLPSQQESNDDGDGTIQRAMPVPPGISVKLATHEIGLNAPAIAASSCGVKVQASPAISLAADQLAEAAMQAALAETKLEVLQSQQHAEMGNTPKVTQPLSEHSMDRTNLMMETVALQGELDTLRGQHRTLHSKLDAVADELAYAVMRASLAELQLEHLRLGRAGTVSGANTICPRPNQHNFDYAPRATQPDSVVSHAAITRVKPEQLLLGIDAPDLFGTDAFALIQQARQLYKELRMVRRALGEVMVTDAVVQSSVDRDALSSAWEAAITAQDRAANLARALHQQQQRTMATKQDADGPTCSFSGDEQPVEKGHATPFPANSLQPEMVRARDAYHDTSEVYEMLRSDAEEINNQLWRWSMKLHQQLSVKEAELTCAQVKFMPGTQLAFESLLSRKEAYVRSVEGQVSELQAGLHAAHSQLLHRAGQVAMLQDMLVQVSEQVTVFEDVVVRCEVLSSGLVRQSEARWG
ncbi:hypothetical protein Vafri_19725 [Volvox africanus]|uniref:Uncharacterized protein n=1 Tax=Volvox africanus TaxID=51714 RepID=A0A8J4BPX9_9CHLO|nr:hypothetical protein Vafri_19725 [Volvox africanus]